MICSDFSGTAADDSEKDRGEQKLVAAYTWKGQWKILLAVDFCPGLYYHKLCISILKRLQAPIAQLDRATGRAKTPESVKLSGVIEF